MKKLWLLALIVVAIFSLFLVRSSFAEELTLDLVKQKVTAAADLLKAEGTAAFPKLKDPNSEFRFAGGAGYVWVHNLEGVMLMHPVKPEMEGKNVLAMKDGNGVTFFANMNEIAKKNGSGWVAYMWTKPKQTTLSPKVSYVVLVGDMVVGSGMYDVTLKDVKAKFPNDPQ